MFAFRPLSRSSEPTSAPAGGLRRGLSAARGSALALCLALVPALGTGCAGGPAPTPEPAMPAMPAPEAPAARHEAPAPAAVPRYSIEDFLEVTDVGGGYFSRDGSKLLVSSNETGITNAYAYGVDGSEPVQLTHSTAEAIGVRGFFPNDDRFVYVSDQGGNELTHVFVQEEDGSVVDLTPGDKVKAAFYGWAYDRKSFYVGTTERDPKRVDLYEHSIEAPYDRTLLYEDHDGLHAADVSPDGRHVLLVKPYTEVASDVMLYDRETKEVTNLTGHEGAQIKADPQGFTADGKSILYTTDEGSEFAYLVRRDLASGKTEELLRPDWDVSYAYVSRENRYLVALVNRDASNQLLLFRYPAMEPVELPELPDLDIVAVRFSDDLGKMAFFANSSTQPENLYVYDFSWDEPRQLTRSLTSKIDPRHLVAAEVVRFDSYDGLEIPGLLYKPHGAGPDHKVPGLVAVHGGPGGQSRIGYNGFAQYLVNHGYAVYFINNRGSSGYGKTFFLADDRKHGNADLGDCVASKKMLADTGWVDGDSIGILGGSYGGYMVLAALTFQPEAFDVGVDLWGISNWVRTLESIPPWWDAIREGLYKEMGDPAKDREYLESISPLFHASNIQRPLMVLQGANDPRVLQAESDDIVEAARKNGVPVEYLVFDDEGHGLRKKENRQRAYSAIVDFLDTHLGRISLPGRGVTSPRPGHSPIPFPLPGRAISGRA